MLSDGSEISSHLSSSVSLLPFSLPIPMNADGEKQNKQPNKKKMMFQQLGTESFGEEICLL